MYSNHSSYYLLPKICRWLATPTYNLPKSATFHTKTFKLTVKLTTRGILPRRRHISCKKTKDVPNSQMSPPSSSTRASARKSCLMVGWHTQPLSSSVPQWPSSLPASFTRDWSTTARRSIQRPRLSRGTRELILRRASAARTGHVLGPLLLSEYTFLRELFTELKALCFCQILFAINVLLDNNQNVVLT